MLFIAISISYLLYWVNYIGMLLALSIDMRYLLTNTIISIS